MKNIIEEGWRIRHALRGLRKERRMRADAHSSNQRFMERHSISGPAPIEEPDKGFLGSGIGSSMSPKTPRR